MSRPCSLYVIATVVDGVPAAPIKVGIARAPKRRLADFQTASPVELRLVLDIVLASRQDASDIERSCHEVAKAAGFHQRGEWVNLDPSEATGLIGTGMDLAFSRHPRTYKSHHAAIQRLSAHWLHLREWARNYVHAEPEPT